MEALDINNIKQDIPLEPKNNDLTIESTIQKKNNIINNKEKESNPPKNSNANEKMNKPLKNGIKRGKPKGEKCNQKETIKTQQKTENFDSNKSSTNLNENSSDHKNEEESYPQEDFQKKEKMNKFLSKGCEKLMEKFELTDFINCGSSCVFYEGRYKKHPMKKVGMKFLINNKISQRKKVKYLHDEISKHNLLKHKNITSILGYYPVKDDCSCIIMEYAKYGDLSKFKNKLKRKYFPETFICYVASEILPAIKYIHDCKICHFDLKKENVLIDDNLNIKLTDFSISLKYGEKYFPVNGTIKLHLAGTNFYMSPEILEEKTIDVKDLNKIDLYSFGVILYNLAFDDFPYYNNKEKKENQPKSYKELKDVMSKAYLKIENDREYSEMFMDFLRKILAKDIKERISVDKAMEHPWIKGGELIKDEKEKVYDINKFLFGLLVDNIKEFNEYIFSDKIKK